MEEGRGRDKKGEKDGKSEGIIQRKSKKEGEGIEKGKRKARWML